MQRFEFLTDRLCHQFPSSKTRGLRSSQLSFPSQQQSYLSQQLSQFPTPNHKPQIPYLSLKPPKPQFKKHPHSLQSLYNTNQLIQVSSVLKQQNTAINSIVSSGFKDVIRRREGEESKESIIVANNNENSRGRENKKQLSYCISPIKVDEQNVMTPVDKQMINVLIKLADRMEKLEEKGKEKDKKMKMSKIITNHNNKSKKKRSGNRNRNNSRIRIQSQSDSSCSQDQYNDSSEGISPNHYQTNKSKSSLKQSKYSSYHHSRSKVYNPLPKQSQSKQQPQIVINNIIKGNKSELLENSRHSRMYDIMDYQLRKQENVIRKLELERIDGRNRIGRERTPNITEFEVEQIQKERVRVEQKQREINVKEREREMEQKRVDMIKQQNYYSQNKQEEQKSEKIGQTNSNNQLYYQRVIKKQSFNPSIFSQYTEYPHSNQPSIQADHRANPSLIRNRIRHNFHQQTTPQPNIIQSNTQSKTQPVQFQFKKPVAFQFPLNSITNSKNKQNVSLAQAFQKRRHQINQDKPKQHQRRQKSKEQLAEIRKNMMKRKPTQSSKPQSMEVTIVDSANTSMKLSKREPSKELLDRLINGTKGIIDKKEMRALTQKNYEQLPEVRQKREDMRKREELEKRMQQKREYDKSIRKHR